MRVVFKIRFYLYPRVRMDTLFIILGLTFNFTTRQIELHSTCPPVHYLDTTPLYQGPRVTGTAQYFPLLRETTLSPVTPCFPDLSTQSVRAQGRVGEVDGRGTVLVGESRDGHGRRLLVNTKTETVPRNSKSKESIVDTLYIKVSRFVFRL